MVKQICALAYLFDKDRRVKQRVNSGCGMNITRLRIWVYIRPKQVAGWDAQALYKGTIDDCQVGLVVVTLRLEGTTCTMTCARGGESRCSPVSISSFSEGFAEENLHLWALSYRSFGLYPFSFK